MKFLKIVFSFIRLRFRAFALYPMGFIIEIARGYVNVGIWFFIALFIQKSTSLNLQSISVNYVGYVVIGVIIFQNAEQLIKEPFNALSQSFWEKKLEIYQTSPLGIWGLVSGRFLFTFFFNGAIQFSIILITIPLLKIQIPGALNVFVFLLLYLLFIVSIFGLSLLGASTFFFLEVKQGREPISWSVNTMVRLFSGVYYPITIFPRYIRWIGKLFPHYYIMSAARSLLAIGKTANIPLITTVLLFFAIIFFFTGIFSLKRAINFAEKRSGMSALV